MRKSSMAMLLALLLCCPLAGCGGAGSASPPSSAAPSSAVPGGSSGAAEEAAWALTVREDALVIECTFPPPEAARDDQGRAYALIPGLPGTMEARSLPFMSLALVLPRDTDAVSLDALWGEEGVLQDVDIDLQEFHPTGSGAASGGGEGGGVPWRADYSVQRFRGVPVVYISVYPVSYDANAKTLAYCREATLTLSLRRDAWDLSRFEAQDAASLADKVDNPEQLAGLAAASPQG